ncbi:MAG: winged helix-turn-helix transcriptional regulator [Promethearchaeota archaeon]
MSNGSNANESKKANFKGNTQQTKILNLLEDEGEWGLTISEIAEKINLNRNSTSKYLEIMADRGEIHKIEKSPTSKFFYPNRVARSIQDRNYYMIKFYQELHKALFKKKSKKAREIGLIMAPKIAELYVKRFGNVDISFEYISTIMSLAVEITYPIANVKANVELKPDKQDSFILTIENCICDGNKDFRSICEIQTGLLKGIIDEVLFPIKVDVKEIECKCDGNTACKYEITKKRKKNHI